MDATYRLQQLRYRVLQVFAMPATGKLLAVLAATVPLIFVSAYTYKAAQGCTWREAVSNNAARVAGLLGFAIIFAVVSNDVNRAINEVCGGNYPVVESGHTLLLGWNAATLPTLRQIEVARRRGVGGGGLRAPVVVLAQRDKGAMDREIADALGGSLRVITRSGCPARPEDLRRAAAGSAGTVILQYPEGACRAQASAQQAAALAALKRAAGAAKVVVQGDGGDAGGGALSPTAVALDALRGWARNGGGAAGGGGGGARVEAEVVVTSGPRRVGQIMAQVALQPGLEYVLGDLLEYEQGNVGAEFHMEPLPAELESRRYSDVRRAYERGVVVGYVAPRGELRLNPRDKDTVPAGSKLVLVTSGASVSRAPEDAPATAAKAPRLRRARGGGPGRRDVAVLCFGEDRSRTLEALASSCQRGSRITFVSSAEPPADELRALQRAGMRVVVISGDPSDGDVLLDAGLHRADALLITGSGASDTQVVASVLQLQALAAQHQDGGRRASPLDVVAAVGSIDTEEVLWHATLAHAVERGQAKAAKAAANGKGAAAAAAAAAAAQQGEGGGGAAAAAQPRAPPAPSVELHLVSPDILMGGMLTQAAVEPQLNKVFAELLASDAGHEVYLRPAAAFGLPPKGKGPHTLAWRQVEEAVRAKGQTALGIAPAAGGPSALRLAPAAGEEVEIAEGDKIVVIARD